MLTKYELVHLFDFLYFVGLYPLIGVLRSFIFNVIIDMLGLRSKFYFVFSFVLYSYLLPALLQVVTYELEFNLIYF